MLMNNNLMMSMMKQQMVQNPQQFAQNALRSGRFKGNEMLTNALNVVASGDIEKTQDMVTNLCKEHNVSIENAMMQYKQYYGVR